MRSKSDWVTAVAVRRIQDKTRWTKAVGEAVTVVYGNCKEEIGHSGHNGMVGYENTAPSVTQRLDGTG
jgi:phage baseplate assembly protein gpV